MSGPLYTPSENEHTAYRDSLGNEPVATSQSTQLPTIMLNVEVLYFQQGEKHNDYKIYQDYIAVPIWFRGFTDKHLFFAAVGPQFNFMVYENEIDLDKSVFGGPKKFDLAVVVGLGFNFGSKKQIEAGGRFTWGVLDMYPDMKGKNWNGAIGAHIAYMF